LLKQVLANLIDNAVKYSRSRDPATIEIGCAGEEAGRAVLFVRDNGVGFEMQYAHKLFGVFQRLHRAEEFEGTGIGLATVRRIVSRHGGRVWAEGTLNEGATFYFTLARWPTE
jgi:light-regulated signal transduction histidine kinase (bacteriophytochrome)